MAALRNRISHIKLTLVIGFCRCLLEAAEQSLCFGLSGLTQFTDGVEGFKSFSSRVFGGFLKTFYLLER